MSKLGENNMEGSKNPYLVKIGEIVKAERNKRKMSQKAFYEFLFPGDYWDDKGIRSKMHDIEHGVVKFIDPVFLQALHDKCNLGMDYIFGFETEFPNHENEQASAYTGLSSKTVEILHELEVAKDASIPELEPEMSDEDYKRLCKMRSDKQEADWILKIFEVLLSEDLDKERWALASRETISKKSTVTSGVLCATSSAMCVIVFSIAMAMIGMFGADRYHYDVRVTLSSKPENYSYVEYLDEVEDYEYVYNKMEILEVNGEEKVSQVYGLPDGGFTYYTAVYDLPSSLNEGEICIERSWARRNGLNIGDTMTITFDPHGVFPIEKTFTVVSFFNIDSYDSMNNNFVISQDEFISIYHDLPYYLLIRTSDPDGVADRIKTYSVGSYMGVATRAELIAEDEQSSVQIRTIFSLVIIVALAMTCIGMISNQLIGFDGRRKECAVMLSTSMDKRTLSGILFREMFITSAVSGTLGTLIGTALIYVVKAAVDYNDAINLPLNINVPAILLIWAAMIVLFALTVLFPIKNLRKMKIAEQIKYE